MILSEIANDFPISVFIIKPPAKQRRAEVIRRVPETGFPGCGRDLIFLWI